MVLFLAQLLVRGDAVQAIVGAAHGAVGVAPMNCVGMFGEVVLDIVKDMAGQNGGWCHHGETWRHRVVLTEK